MSNTVATGAPFPEEPEGLTDNQRRIIHSMRDLVENAMFSRHRFAKTLMDPRRDIDKECGYPETARIDTAMYKEMYDRLSIAARVVEVFPKESWQKQPTVFEDEDAENITPFEQAWDELPKTLRGKSWYQDEEGNPIWEMLMRLDIAAGIGHFGIMIMGIDDGLELSEPVQGSEKWFDAPTNYGGIQGTDAQYYDAATGSPMDANLPLDKKKAAADKGSVDSLLKQPEDKDTEANPKKGSVDSLLAGQKPKRDKEEITQNLTRADSNPTERGAEPSDKGPKKPVDASKGSSDAPPSGSKPPAGGKGGDSAAASPPSLDDKDKVPVAVDGRFKTKGEDPPKEVKTKRRLLYLRVFDESLVQITQFDADPKSPRYGQPVMYQVTFNSPEDSTHGGIGITTNTKNVHWSRVIHVADTFHSFSASEVFAVPRQRPVWNRLCDLVKLYGGSAEMYWRGAFPGLSFETHPQLGGEVSIDKADMKDQMEKYMNGLQRYLTSEGMAVKSIAPQVSDPTPQINTQVEAICIVIAVPMRILRGSERGELASGQDDGTWNGRVMTRQTFFNTPRIVIPFVDRCILMEVLPEPKGYSVEWPDLDALQPLEEAQWAFQMIQALAAYIQGGCDVIIPPLELLVHFFHLDEELAQELIEKAMDHIADANPHATDEEIVPGRDPAPETPELVFGPDGMPIDQGTFGKPGKKTPQDIKQAQKGMIDMKKAGKPDKPFGKAKKNKKPKGGK